MAHCDPDLELQCLWTHSLLPCLFSPLTEMRYGRGGRSEDIREGGMIGSSGLTPLRSAAGRQAQFNEHKSQTEVAASSCFLYTLSLSLCCQNPNYFAPVLHHDAFVMI